MGLKLAIAQTRIQLEQPAENLRKAAGWIAQAAQERCDGIVFPEMSFTGFSMHVPQIAACVPEIHRQMIHLARQHSIAIGYGWTEQTPEGKGRNHYTLLDANGAQVLDYVKIHPFSYGGEDQYYQGGIRISAAVFCGVPASVLICYDLRFPEIFRVAAQRSRLLLVPANWLSRRSAHFQILLQARAIENQVYVLGVNCTGTQGKNQFSGGSCLVSPEGELLLACGTEETLSYVTWEENAKAYRDAFPTVQDARLSLYAALYQELLSEPEG